ncbi:hypothetical protein RRG08_066976 [Elysia crispata]|uniref:Uncharacterized protein n=1 Tax=Elysia crispata TaxID=231223 RepID=A0AAE0Z9N1_9GAST|nr:hypothetical protein RRG08_066976 [Elysia crispata]
MRIRDGIENTIFQHLRENLTNHWPVPPGIPVRPPVPAVASSQARMHIHEAMSLRRGYEPDGSARLFSAARTGEGTPSPSSSGGSPAG